MKHWIDADWPAAQNVHAITTLRSGGVSTNPFASLNVADHVHDEAENVRDNRKVITQMLNLPTEPVWLQQVHSNRVIQLTHNTADPQADASFTHQSGIVCAIVTADCLPILLSSKDGGIIAALHAGWRGLLNGIISRTVKALGKQHLIAWLGPAIGANCFEVGTEVKDQFVSKSAMFNAAFTQNNQHHYLADIYQIARLELKALGITGVYGGGFCTVTDHQRFYSYRRDGETGRMATLIWRD